MKAFIIIVTCSFLLLQGCYTSQTVSVQELNQNDNDFAVTRTDGETIECDAYRYLLVNKPSDAILVTDGERFDAKGGSSGFRGPVKPVSVDSSSVDKLIPTGWSKEEKRRIQYYTFRLPDSSVVRAEKRCVVAIDSSGGPALYYAGRPGLPGTELDNRGKIRLDEIKKVESRKLDIVGTTLASVGIAALVTIIAAAAAFGKFDLNSNFPK